MKAHKKLIGAIAFLVLQVIVLIVNGLPKLDGGAYDMGYLVGTLAPGVIGIILLVVYFLGKGKAK